MIAKSMYMIDLGNRLSGDVMVTTDELASHTADDAAVADVRATPRTLGVSRFLGF